MPNTETLATSQPQTNADGTPVVAGEKPAEGTKPTEGQPAEGSPEAKVAAEAKAKQEADVKAEETRRAALTEDQRKAEDKAKADAEAKRAANFGAPEKYEFKPVEGKVAIDTEIATELTAIAKELDLSQAGAQRLHDLGVKVAEKQFERVQEQIEKTKADWTVLSKSDKEFGGDKIDANLGVARKALEVHGTPELKTLLNDTGLGNHPEIIRWMFRVGKTLQQDSHVTGTGTGPNQRTPQTFYNNSKMNP